MSTFYRQELNWGGRVVKEKKVRINLKQGLQLKNLRGQVDGRNEGGRQVTFAPQVRTRQYAVCGWGDHGELNSLGPSQRGASTQRLPAVAMGEGGPQTCLILPISKRS